MDFLEGLNPQQAEAVRHRDGPLLILAGAGSGKTRVITHRIAHLICSQGVAPWSILAVTFTNKAAQEMRERVLKLLEGRLFSDGPTVCTFHSFCVRLLRRFGGPLAALRPGFSTSFAIYDDDDQMALIKAIYRDLGIDDKALSSRAVLAMISRAKCAKQGPEEWKAKASDPASKKIAEIYDQYEARLRAANALDFDDLLLESVRLLQHDQDLRNSWNERLTHLMIDEYQDTNANQYELMRLLAGKQGNVCVVGDEDQSIYSWRGADIRNILDFQKDFPNATVIRLEQNYRSTKSILAAASGVVANNTNRLGKKLWTAGAEGDPVVIYEAVDSDAEAFFIADMVEKLIHDDSRNRIAILYRTNFQSRAIEEALRRHGRKYKVVGGVSFYQRAEIKDLLCYLRLVVDPADNLALLRIINTPARGIGKTTVETLEQIALAHKISLWAAIQQALEQQELGPRARAALTAFRDLIVELRQASHQKRVDELLETIYERTGYKLMLEQDHTEEGETREANVAELLRAASEAADQGESAVEFLDHAALVSDADQVDETAQVSLLTMHNAKGLEFPIVFVAGMEEGLFPHKRSLDSPAMLEEERRLCYVAMTRAQKQLFLTWARSRRKFGGSPPEPSIPSRFLREVPPHTARKLGGVSSSAEIDLLGERFEVRHTVRKNLYTGKTYNSVENVANFFKERNIPVNLRPPDAGQARPQPQPPPPAEAKQPAAAPAEAKGPKKKSKLSQGAEVTHPNYGRGSIVRVEGEGPDAKVTVLFPGYGLKKLIAKYAGLAD
ncbi:MAG: UvrD-helicase domain-containing protein [Bryobacteraceae bacterium]|nr:UvrD-helicase domain-containing protein [Bryobacteraceae bacterium]MDW8376732.1 UvrD-helicase domain-containing protein [Bryobacterales bacterium]